MNEQKICNKCNIIKPISNFNRKLDSKDGYQLFCRQCIIRYKKIYQEYIKIKLID